MERSNVLINLPNTLTATRILVVPFYIVALLYDRYGWALAFFAAASVTDFLDGLTARIQNQYTRFGEVLDPIADKVLLISSFVLFGVFGWVPPWLAVTVISRDLIVMFGTMLLYLTSGVLTVSVSFWGKLTTFLQIFQLAFILLAVNITGEPKAPMALHVVVFLGTVFSGVHYVMKGLRIANNGATRD